MTVVAGDMREVLATWRSECVHAIVTDPPYGLSFMGKGWDGQVPGPEYWREVLRVAKPGAHLLAFGGTRTAHRLACAIEDAGWEIRDCLSWLYGSGFPKSHDVSKAIDRDLGAEREVIGTHRAPGYAFTNVEQGECVRTRYQFDKTGGPATAAARAWSGWGTALKPAWEPIYLARKPFKRSVSSNVVEHGCGALNIDGCRIATGDNLNGGRYALNKIGDDGSAYGSGINLRSVNDYQQPLGRWPANLVLDETAAAMLDAQTGDLGLSKGGSRGRSAHPSSYGMDAQPNVQPGYYDNGGASRFFYVAKASRSEREAGLNGNGTRANTHPTVKPIALMRYLVRLITPPGGIVLDPFAGSGSTGCAVVMEGFTFVGCEIEPAYVEIALARIKACL